MKQPSLRPSDLVTALDIAAAPGSRLADIAARTRKSLGETHNAVRRLAMAGLLLDNSRAVAVEPLLAFVRWGLPFAFPAVTGGPAVGVPTAQLNPVGTAPPDASALAKMHTEFVWPLADGPATGTALIPLFPAAPRLLESNPVLAGLLSLVDLVRIGGARERDAALAALAERLTNSGT